MASQSLLAWIVVVISLVLVGLMCWIEQQKMEADLDDDHQQARLTKSTWAFNGLTVLVLTSIVASVLAATQG